MWNTEKIFVHPDLMLCPWEGHNSVGKQLLVIRLIGVFMTGTCIWTMLATHLTTMSLTVPHLLFFIMCSKGLVHKIFRGSAQNLQQMEKSPEKILLEMEIWQLSLLDELLGQLSEKWSDAFFFTLDASSLWRPDPQFSNRQYLRESTAKKEISWIVFTPTKLKCSPRT